MTDNVLILGIGNILWSDEGFGVRCVEQLHRDYLFDDHVRLIEGGTQGVHLLEYVEAADRLVIFDAVDFGLEPGEMKIAENEGVPQYMGAKKMSLHQTGFQEVLAMATMLDRLPQEMLLIGVQPVVLEDYGGSLHPLTRSKIEPCIETALAWLKHRGVVASERETPPEEGLGGAAVDIEAYENERPDPATACRVGDERVLYSQRYAVEYRPHPIDPETKISCDVDSRGKY